MDSDIPPEVQARLGAEVAQQRIDADEDVHTLSQPRLSHATNDSDTEEAAFADVRALSLPTLQEYWINEEDAVYDSL